MPAGADRARPPAGAEPRAGAPALRRDARRNRELLIEAAHEVFAEQGLEAPLDAIARRAGVGNATLYRHFPSRVALVDAVFRDPLTDTMAAGEQARAAEDAWAGLTGYLEAVFTVLATDRGTNDLMTTPLRGVKALEAVHAHNRRTLELLLGRGRAQGTVRPEVTAEDVLFALAALGRAVPALTSAAAPDAWRRPLALFLDGLRATATASPLPSPALTATQLGDVLGELGPHRAPTSAGDARTTGRGARKG
ncbi:helix-turn-helix domain-containing protein [Streptomyces sp. B-S-A8]|uniref:Helix-turn-helix domain-containing protein n=1 Tax=Streptomyces solicavernae TaxID=3043614 RepID=A0ABT6RUN6_9ACTN|nr:TetR/AcrR family transcriptional regulator [Streptomyces sp. B-S-A8]MDI3387894.1 helix-turn-helix domain-containing protein [Streptomyces sp. B-S-A8]